MLVKHRNQQSSTAAFIPPVNSNRKTARQRWMGTLAKSSLRDLEAAWRKLGERPAYRFLRKPESGLVMVRGRAGGSGRRFNLGEMTVTRCVVEVENQHTGFSYVAGRDHRHAELAAVFDALLQDPQRTETLSGIVIGALDRILRQKRAKQAKKAAASKVDFFTMVRGEG